MNKIDLGKSGLLAPEIALGCMRIKDLSANDAAAVVRTSIDAGITFFDHADIYGEDGASETIFGNAVKELGIRREDILLQTKCGIEKNPNGKGAIAYNFGKDHIVSTVEQSLKRLQTDYVDLLALHRPDSLVEPDEVAAALDILHSSGKVLHFGVSNFNPGQMALQQKSTSFKFIVNQLQLSLVHTGMIDCGFNVNIPNDPGCDRDGGILEYCRFHDVTIQAWSPFVRTVVSRSFIDDPGLPELNLKMAEIAEKYSVTKDAVAAAWILRHPAKIQVIIGSMNPQRIENISKASGFTLTHREWYELYLSAGNQIP